MPRYGPVRLLCDFKKGRTPEEKAEAFLQFQIQVKREETEELGKILAGLEADNGSLTAQLQQLKEEQRDCMRGLFQQAKKQQEIVEQATALGQEQVGQAQRDILELARQQEETVAELHRQLEALEVQEKELLHQSMNMDRSTYQQQIDKLQAELISEQKWLDGRLETHRRCMEATFRDMETKTAQLIEEIKHQAVKNAMKEGSLRTSS